MKAWLYRQRKAIGASAVIIGLTLLYFFNPATNGWYPRCPFFVLTGWKCPGCGTLRALHLLSHGEFAAALKMNPLTVVSVPLVCALLAFPRLARNLWVAVGLFVLVVAFWFARNLV